MQEPSSTKTSDAKTRIVPVSYPKMTVKLRPPPSKRPHTAHLSHSKEADLADRHE